MIELNFIYCLIRRTAVLASLLVLNCCALFALPAAPASLDTVPAPAAGMHAGPRTAQQLAILTHRLALSPQQQVQIENVLAAERRALIPLRNRIVDTPRPADADFAALAALQGTTRARIASLLREDQKMELAIWQDSRGEFAHDLDQVQAQIQAQIQDQIEAQVQQDEPPSAAPAAALPPDVSTI